MGNTDSVRPTREQVAESERIWELYTQEAKERKRQMLVWASPGSIVQPQVVKPEIKPPEQKNIVKAPVPTKVRRNRDIQSSLSRFQSGIWPSVDNRQFSTGRASATSLFRIQPPRRMRQTGCKCVVEGKSLHEHLLIECPAFVRAVSVKTWRLLVAEHATRARLINAVTPQPVVDELIVKFFHDILDNQIQVLDGDFPDEMLAVAKLVREAMPIFDQDCKCCAKTLKSSKCNSYCDLMLKCFGVQCSSSCVWPRCVKSASGVTAQ
jgi:hypothetical protein